jgi:hypothetical protein
MRLATFKNDAEDPLLSAISSCTSVLADHVRLKSFQSTYCFATLNAFLNPHHGDSAYNL